MELGSLQRTDLNQDGLEGAVHASDRNRSIAFDRFVAQPCARMLLRDGHPLELGARAFDMLMVLLASRGEIVSKDEIMAYVWPTTTVDESNLRFQMAVLRKALGKGRSLIKTVPGRGYLLVDEMDEPHIGVVAPPDQHVGARALTEGERSVFDALRALLVVAGRCPAALASLNAALSTMGSAAKG